METNYILPGKLRDALISFFRKNMNMEAAEGPVNDLRALKPLQEGEDVKTLKECTKEIQEKVDQKAGKDGN